MVIYERTEEVLAFSDHYVAGSARRVNRAYFGLCRCAVHLYAVLEPAGVWQLNLRKHHEL